MLIKEALRSVVPSKQKEKGRVRVRFDKKTEKETGRDRMG